MIRVSSPAVFLPVHWIPRNVWKAEKEICSSLLPGYDIEEATTNLEKSRKVELVRADIAAFWISEKHNMKVPFN